MLDLGPPGRPAVGGLELHGSRQVPRVAIHDIDDPQSQPLVPRWVHRPGPRAGMPGPPQMIGVVEDECGIAGAHECFSGPSACSIEQRPAALAVRAPATRTGGVERKGTHAAHHLRYPAADHIDRTGISNVVVPH